MTDDDAISDTALHEAGHAVVLMSCGYGERLGGAGLTPDDPRCLGYVHYAIDGVILELPGMRFPSDLNLAASMVLTSLGGVAAEGAFGSGPVPRGWQSDMVRAITMIHYLATMDPQGIATTYSMLTQALIGPEDPLVEPCDASIDGLLELIQETFGKSLTAIIADMTQEATRRIAANPFAVLRIARELIWKGEADGARLRELAEASLGWCGDMGAPRYFGHHPVGWDR